MVSSLHNTHNHIFIHRSFIVLNSIESTDPTQQWQLNFNPKLVGVGYMDLSDVKSELLRIQRIETELRREKKERDEKSRRVDERRIERNIIDS